jgi:HAD superfamily hydrolase (TIGR01509 family)
MKGIIFDCDGTLVDSEHAHMVSWRAAVLKRGGDLTQDDYLQLAGYPESLISAKLHALTQVDSPEAIAEDKQQEFFKLLQQGIPAMERMVALIRQLIPMKNALNIKLAVASAARKNEVLYHLDRLGIKHAFDAVVSGRDDLFHIHDSEGVNKPKPYIYQHTAELLQLEPSCCMAFEDSGPGVQAAARAGVVAVAVPNAFTLNHDFSPAHHMIGLDETLELEQLLGLLNRNLLSADT